MDSLAWVKFKRGRHKEALSLLRRANVLAPGEPVILQHLGEVYARLRDLKRARAAFRRALALEPEERVRLAIEGKLRELEGR